MIGCSDCDKNCRLLRRVPWKSDVFARSERSDRLDPVPGTLADVTRKEEMRMYIFPHPYFEIPFTCL